jgi:hypothetical protein
MVLDTTLSPMGDPNGPTAQMRAVGDDFTSHGNVSIVADTEGNMIGLDSTTE